MNQEEYDVNKFERPSVTVDLVVFSIINDNLKILLIKRKEWPFKGKLALPGGFIKMDETLEEAAERELREETGLKNQYLEQLYTFGDVKRDPRTRVITISYLALINSENITLKAGTDAESVNWFDVKNIDNLAFDHNMIINYALERLRTKISYSNIVFGLLPELFTLTEVQKAYEIILDKELDKRNFRKKLNSLNIIEKTNLTRKDGLHRPATLYRLFNKEFELKIFK